jgi:hypothetical protein
LDIGKAKSSAAIARSLYNKAMGGDTTAMIWWTKAQMRWSETVKNEVTGADGEPFDIQITFVKPKDE